MFMRTHVHEDVDSKTAVFDVRGTEHLIEI